MISCCTLLKIFINLLTDHINEVMQTSSFSDCIYFIIFTLMRFLAFLFAMYVLALSAMPCNDLHDGRSLTKNTTEVITGLPHDGDHLDLCSPFCICSCCNTSIVFNFNIPSIKIPDILIENNKKSGILSSSFISSFYGKIWQPPQSA